MSEMTDVKKYLQQVRLYDSRINAKLAERDRLKAMLTKITPTLRNDAVSGGHGSQDKFSDGMAKLVDLEAEINREVDRFVNERNAVTATIDSVDDERLHRVLSGRYIQFKTWEQIACDMDVSYQWVCKLHGTALQAVEKILKNPEKSATVDRSL